MALPHRLGRLEGQPGAVPGGEHAGEVGGHGPVHLDEAPLCLQIREQIGGGHRLPEDEHPGTGKLPILNFNDNSEIPKWSEKYIYMANKIGLINGDEYGNVMPTKALTKAEIATITNNMVKYIIEELGEEYIL